MRKKQILLLSLLVTLGFIAFVPLINVQATEYACPDTSTGDTKVLKVTVADNETMTDLFGSSWESKIETAFQEGSSTLGAKQKYLVQGINKSDTLDVRDPFDTFTIIDDAPVCNITVNVYNWTTGEITEDLKNPAVNTYVLKNPKNVTYYAVTWTTTWSAVPGITPSNASVQNAGSFLAQLPGEDCAAYLDEITWVENWTTPGRAIRHDFYAGESGGYYLEDGSETWSYSSNGALISYELKDSEGTTAYKFELELPEIPGYELTIFLGITAISMIGIITLVKKKKQI
ncbi:MAG: hypothetical protein ACQERB_16950 [Promethearchaeati archaeon]